MFLFTSTILQYMADGHQNEAIMFDTAPANFVLEARLSILSTTANLHADFTANCSHENKISLLRSLTAQRKLRKKAGIFLGSYTEADAPTDLDSIASILSVQFCQHHVVTDSKGAHVPIWTTRHGSASDPVAPFDIIFTESDKSCGHFQLILLHGNYVQFLLTS